MQTVRKYGLLFAFIICGVIFAWFISSNHSNTDTNIAFHIGYSDNSKEEIISETQYIPDSNGHSFFVCHSRDGKLPCEEIKGIRHGVEKWYKSKTLEYEDFYYYGAIEQSVLYYPNGLKKQESFYENDKLVQQNFYENEKINPLTKTIIYKNNEIIKKYYKNNKIYKEEEYQDDILRRRKLYDSDGLLKQLEEYGSSVRQFDPFDFDDFNPWWQDSQRYHKRFQDIPNNPPSQQNDNNRSGSWI